MQITRGRLLAQRFFDLADEVDLAHAESLLHSASRPSRFVRAARQIRMPRPPLELTLPARASGIPQCPPGEVLIRLYDVGVLAITFNHPLPSPLTGDALISLAALAFEADALVSQSARQVADEVLAAVRAACRKPGISDITEDYTVFRIDATEPQYDAEGLLNELDVARVLLGEIGPLSRSERDKVMDKRFSYDPRQVVIIDWNSALLYGDGSDTDVLELLELASMELLEMRAYDDAAGRSLDRLYDEVANERVMLFASTRYRRLSREIMRMFVDFKDAAERVDNSLQLLGDTYLARIHRAAVALFDIPRWERQLEEKLELLRQISEMLVDQITARQSLRLEWAIVLLIVAEVLFTVLKLV